MGQKTTFSELLETHQKLDKLREDLEIGIRGLRKKSTGSWGPGSAQAVEFDRDVEKDERPSVRLLHDRLKEVRSEILELAQLDLEILPKGAVNA